MQDLDKLLSAVAELLDASKAVSNCAYNLCQEGDMRNRDKVFGHVKTYDAKALEVRRLLNGARP